MSLFEPHDVPSGDWPELQSADELIARLRVRLRPNYDMTEGSGSLRNSGCMECYTQLMCRRLLVLIDAITIFGEPICKCHVS